MTDDLVARAKRASLDWPRGIMQELVWECAAEIERQREVERLLHESFQQSTAKIEQQEAEIERLRADNAATGELEARSISIIQTLRGEIERLQEEFALVTADAALS